MVGQAVRVRDSDFHDSDFHDSDVRESDVRESRRVSFHSPAQGAMDSEERRPAEPPKKADERMRTRLFRTRKGRERAEKGPRKGQEKGRSSLEVGLSLSDCTVLSLSLSERLAPLEQSVVSVSFHGPERPKKNKTT